MGIRRHCRPRVSSRRVAAYSKPLDSTAVMPHARGKGVEPPPKQDISAAVLVDYVRYHVCGLHQWLAERVYKADVLQDQRRTRLASPYAIARFLHRIPYLCLCAAATGVGNNAAGLAAATGGQVLIEALREQPPRGPSRLRCPEETRFFHTITLSRTEPDSAIAWEVLANISSFFS